VLEGWSVLFIFELTLFFVVEHPTKINSIEINKNVFLNSIFI
jgi:hypothetical protein